MPAMAIRAKSKALQRFSSDILVLLRNGKILRIRAGTGPHRFIGVWFTVVNDRVFVRSWSVKPAGWYHAFLAESRGAIRIADRDTAVLPVPIRDERVLDASH